MLGYAEMRTGLVWQKRREAVGVVLPIEIAESTAGGAACCEAGAAQECGVEQIGERRRGCDDRRPARVRTISEAGLGVSTPIARLGFCDFAG